MGDARAWEVRAPQGISAPKHSLRLGVTLLSRQTVPTERFGLVLGDTLAAKIHVPELNCAKGKPCSARRRRFASRSGSCASVQGAISVNASRERARVVRVRVGRRSISSPDGDQLVGHRVSIALAFRSPRFNTSAVAWQENPWSTRCGLIRSTALASCSACRFSLAAAAASGG